MIETIAEVLNVLPRLLSELGERCLEYRSPEYDVVTPLADFLTCRLVYFLRCLEQITDPRSRSAYARMLAAYIDDGRPSFRRPADADQVWERAAQYACAYLFALGLVQKVDAVGAEVVITDRGRTVIASTAIHERFRSAFEQDLPA